MNIQEFEDRFKLISKKFNEIKNHLDIKNKKIILNDLESKTVVAPRRPCKISKIKQKIEVFHKVLKFLEFNFAKQSKTIIKTPIITPPLKR